MSENYNKISEKEKILIDNFNEYFSSGLEAYKTEKFNVAATLFFKAIAALCDLYILRKESISPSSHTNRFRILEDKYPYLYKIIDRDFPFYQDSYIKKMDKESVTLLKEDAETIKKMLGI